MECKVGTVGHAIHLQALHFHLQALHLVRRTPSDTVGHVKNGMQGLANGMQDLANGSRFEMKNLADGSRVGRVGHGR